MSGLPANMFSVFVELLEQYGIDISKWERARCKRASLANMHYLRHGRTFTLITTHGRHRFFDDEANVIRDIRRVPFKVERSRVSSSGERAPSRGSKSNRIP